MKRFAAFVLAVLCLVLAGAACYLGFFDPHMPPRPAGWGLNFVPREMGAMVVIVCGFIGAILFGLLAAGDTPMN